MKRTTDVRSVSFLIVIAILLVSLLLNVYQGVINEKSKYMIGEASSKNIEEIRNRNESIFTTLEKCVTAKSITNEELLGLYKNFTKIATAEVELWEHYLKYKKSSGLAVTSKKFDENNLKSIELYWSIEEFMYDLVQQEMTTNREHIELNGKVLTDFTILKNMASDINDYFISFSKQYLNGLESEARSKEIIKKEYWRDMLIGVQESSEEYIDYVFTCQ